MADVPTFRMVFPEFANSTSDDQVAYWMGQATFETSPNTTTIPTPYGFGFNMVGRLGKSYDLAVMLFAAHNIVLGLDSAAAAARGSTPGSAVAPLTSKGAGGLSASYDANIASTAGAGIYNGTSYGQRLWKLLEIAALGGVYSAPPPNQTVFGYNGLPGGRGWE